MNVSNPQFSCSTLTEALDRCKRKYQAKLRKTEQQMIAVMRGAGTAEAKIREEENPLPGKNSSQSSDQPKTPKTSSSKIPLPRLEGKAL